MSHRRLTTTPERARPDGQEAADLAEINARQRADRRLRAGLATGAVLIGAALTWPVLTTIPPRILAALALLALAMVGTHSAVMTAADWLRGRYEVDFAHPWRVWRWRIVRRWYAPGSTVWHTAPTEEGEGPLAVLDWHHDPACRQAWALVYDGAPLMSGGTGAQWLPLDRLAPTPPLPAGVTPLPTARTR